jgi:ATP-dependent RNA helicase RhlE
VATDIAARGIDVQELGHVVNFDVPLVPEDYIHRVGRTARAEATGDAFTFVAPQEEADLRSIEAAIKKRLPRVTVPDFDYNARPVSLEIPLAERIKAIRERKSAERARAADKQRRRGGAGAPAAPRPSGGGAAKATPYGGSRPGGGGFGTRSFGPRRPGGGASRGPARRQR